jgi:hypothetical protein
LALLFSPLTFLKHITQASPARSFVALDAHTEKTVRNNSRSAFSLGFSIINAHVYPKEPVLTLAPDLFKCSQQPGWDGVLIFVIHGGVIRAGQVF